MTDADSRYQAERMAHRNRVAASKNDTHRLGAFYQQLLEHYCPMIIQLGLRILEIGSGAGFLKQYVTHLITSEIMDVSNVDVILGGQYLPSAGVQSISRKGNCWDKAVAESFFHTLKTQLMSPLGNGRKSLAFRRKL